MNIGQISYVRGRYRRQNIQYIISIVSHLSHVLGVKFLRVPAAKLLNQAVQSEHQPHSLGFVPL